MTLTAQRLREVLDYDPDTGLFQWRVRTSSCVRIGAVAGCKDNGIGYRTIRIDKGLYHAHRLVWLHVYGRWPDNDIDHINGDRSDNRLCNLRDVPRLKNTWNTGKSAKNSTGYKGVMHEPSQPGRYRAQIRVRGKNHYLGLFDCPEAAGDAYKAAALRLRGESGRE